ncbi:MAG: hypothetical protein JWO19_1194, partial [Bryobacterales bacterium]|nr:hypothetical protein [Bryobacterales bacterium]
RSLIRGLAGRGHRVLFLERDAPWYADNRDELNPPGAVTEIYANFDELLTRFESAVERASLVMVGSYVPEGVRCGEWVTSVAQGKTAFYDIDTPVTLGKLEAGDQEYITPALIRRYDAYLSFTGGPTLRTIESRYGSPMARALYCSVDPEQYQPVSAEKRWDMGYLGTYSVDRQPTLNELLIEPARQWSKGRFAVAGPLYPDNIEWPANVRRTPHLSPREHALFYSSQRFTLNVTREAMKHAGYSPSVRLFEAAACEVAMVSDAWHGLDTVFRIGKEVLVAEKTEDTLRILHDLPEAERLNIGRAARRRVLAEHTPRQRVIQLEGYLKEMNDNLSSGSTRRNRRDRQIYSGMESGLPSEREREGTRAAAGAETGAIPDPRGLHKPSGASF